MKGDVIMARIKIEDLPTDTNISKEEMRKVLGGMLRTPASTGLVGNLPNTQELQGDDLVAGLQPNGMDPAESQQISEIIFQGGGGGTSDLPIKKQTNRLT